MSRILIGNALWKSVENLSSPGAHSLSEERLRQSLACGEPNAQTLPVLACSACAGDYEDPDRTAWAPDAEEDEESPPQQAEEERAEGKEEFPAKDA